ncbi:MAG: hypothetical protein ACKVZ6_01735 [Kineosporiaceae bacterium]|jgi:hypothetical protein
MNRTPHRAAGPRRRPALAIASGVTLALAVAALPAAATAPTPATVGGSPVTSARTVAAGSTAGDDWPITECGTYSGKGCAPTSARVDLVKPTFSHPTKITNPLFPISRTRQVIQTGTVGGTPFRSETTLLPQTGTVDWDGTSIQVVLAQYLAFSDGEIEEIALDRYAQADDGAVWYLGEDVFDYTDGTISVSEGTWLAGRDGPPAMIMPAHPKVGDVFRAENILGVVFEEIKVTAVDQTVAGPTGPVRGAITVSELRLDSTFSHKTFAPGYGEFRTVDGGDVEALAVAAPTDAVPGPVPPALRSLTTSAWGVVENARVEDWDGAAATVARMNRYWTTLKAGPQPRLVAARMTTALAALKAAVNARRTAATVQAGIDVAEAALDLQLRHRSVDQVNAERVHQHAQQLRLDAVTKNAAGVTGQVAAVEWTTARLPVPPVAAAEIDNRLRDLRTAADTRNLPATADHAARLAARLRVLG